MVEKNPAVPFIFLHFSIALETFTSGTDPQQSLLHPGKWLVCFAKFQTQAIFCCNRHVHLSFRINVEWYNPQHITSWQKKGILWPTVFEIIYRFDELTWYSFGNLKDFFFHHQHNMSSVSHWGQRCLCQVVEVACQNILLEKDDGAQMFGI